jgi:hypothetical protein
MGKIFLPIPETKYDKFIIGRLNEFAPAFQRSLAQGCRRWVSSNLPPAQRSAANPSSAAFRCHQTEQHIFRRPPSAKTPAPGRADWW